MSFFKCFFFLYNILSISKVFFFLFINFSIVSISNLKINDNNNKIIQLNFPYHYMIEHSIPFLINSYNFIKIIINFFNFF